MEIELGLVAAPAALETTDVDGMTEVGAKAIETVAGTAADLVAAAALAIEAATVDMVATIVQSSEVVAEGCSI